MKVQNLIVSDWANLKLRHRNW